MKQKTIKRLLELNKNFYSQVAHEFDLSRQAMWPGWEKLSQLVKKLNPQAKIYDIGCGNGRFGSWLQNQGFSGEYVGVDQSTLLLKRAEHSLSDADFSVSAHSINIASQQLTKHLPLASADLLVCLAVLHHIPSYHLRLRILQQFHQLLKPGGTLIISAWQFMNDQRAQSKLITPEEISDLDPHDLEINDHFLGWQNIPQAIRYCHLIDEQEAKRLFIEAGFKINKTFFADGQDQRSNLYLIATA